MSKKKVAGLVIGVVAVIVILITVLVLSSAQYAIYKMNQAAGQNNLTTFMKYYAIPFPHPHDNLSIAQKQSNALADYKSKDYQPLPLSKVLFSKSIHEQAEPGTVNAGTLYIVKGQKYVVYRMVRHNGTWQAEDIARLK